MTTRGYVPPHLRHGNSNESPSRESWVLPDMMQEAECQREMRSNSDASQRGSQATRGRSRPGHAREERPGHSSHQHSGDQGERQGRVQNPNSNAREWNDVSDEDDRQDHGGQVLGDHEGESASSIEDAAKKLKEAKSQGNIRNPNSRDNSKHGWSTISDKQNDKGLIEHAPWTKPARSNLALPERVPKGPSDGGFGVFGPRNIKNAENHGALFRQTVSHFERETARGSSISPRRIHPANNGKDGRFTPWSGQKGHHGLEEGRLTPPPPIDTASSDGGSGNEDNGEGTDRSGNKAQPSRATHRSLSVSGYRAKKSDIITGCVPASGDIREEAIDQVLNALATGIQSLNECRDNLRLSHAELDEVKRRLQQAQSVRQLQQISVSATATAKPQNTTERADVQSRLQHNTGLNLGTSSSSPSTLPSTTSILNTSARDIVQRVRLDRGNDAPVEGLSGSKYAPDKESKQETRTTEQQATKIKQKDSDVKKSEDLNEGDGNTKW